CMANAAFVASRGSAQPSRPSPPGAGQAVDRRPGNRCGVAETCIISRHPASACLTPHATEPENAAIDLTLQPGQLQSLFDPLPDVVFFVKDIECRYAHVNQTLIQRLGLRRREDIIGKSVLELYPASLSAAYIMQDRRVLAGEVIENLLELQLYPNRMRGWCLTLKQPIRIDGRIVGLTGISRDLGQPDSQHSSFSRLQQAVNHMQANFSAPLRVQTLADIAGVSVS